MVISYEYQLGLTGMLPGDWIDSILALRAPYACRAYVTSMTFVCLSVRL